MMSYWVGLGWFKIDWIVKSVTIYNKIYREKSIPMIALWCPAFSIMVDFIMPETQQPIIVIILIIYSPYLLKDLVEL